VSRACDDTLSLPDIMSLLTAEDIESITRELAGLRCCALFAESDLTGRFDRYCTTVLTPALHNVLETSAREGSEFSLPSLVEGFVAYKEARASASCICPRSCHCSSLSGVVPVALH
jgi:hypothetical protein